MTPDATLRDVFERFVLKERPGLTAERVQDYRRHIDRFNTRMAYPGVAGITNLTLLEFRETLQGETKPDGTPALSNRSVNKHLADLRTVLLAAEGLGLIHRAPQLRALPARKAAEKLYLQYDQLDSLYRACDAAAWPPGLPWPASRYWRVALVLWFNFGLRTQELIRYESKNRAMVWSNVYWQANSPAELSRLENRWGWLRYIPQKQERLKPDPLTVPLNETAHRHLQAIAPVGTAASEWVFPFPLSNVAFNRTWAAIRDSAGVDERFSIKHIRKTCITWHNYHQHGIARYVTGHADRRGGAADVSSQHYDNGEMRLLEAMQAFPQPQAFVDGLQLLDAV